ncbi:hypothetical protein J437_LFUL015804 [Ladona fulva]|uniref:RRM domain-containing protein n=1 Tax=Ladona fulva TaxID=123851 RepID=A0A8K0KKH6_LADFU|nr:hypothetical protein J437_LFUL015804 [Ladona fulva]
MSLVSAEGISNSKTNIKCFNENLLKSKHDKYWADEVLATASTGEFWEDDPSEKVKRRVNELHRIFHKERGLMVKNLPRDVTEEEIRELLSDFPVHSVQIMAGVSGSVHALVSLEDPEMLEEWDREKIFILRSQRLPVAPERTEMVLCVARLPLTYTEEEFKTLVQNHGEVNMCFLMISEKSGESKGYGFVKYSSKDAALKAKDLLNGKQIDNNTLCCDWLDTSHVTFASLHSKCLYVDQLPPDFRDMAEFRKVFSTKVNPPYCQIALKNGCPQNWGLVEFNSADDAENTQVSLVGYKLRGSLLRVSYCIPGVHAINLYLTLINDSDNKGKSALLPDPPGPAVFQQFQSLAMRNPVFAQNLQNIILQSAQKRNNSLDTSKQISTTVAEARSSNTVDTAFTSVGNIDNLSTSLGVNLEKQLQFQLDNNQSPFVRNPQMFALMQSLLGKPMSNQFNVQLPLAQDNVMRPPLQIPNWLGNALPSQIDVPQFSNHSLRQIHPGLLNPANSQKVFQRKINLKPGLMQKTSMLPPLPERVLEEMPLKRDYSKSLEDLSGREMVGMTLPAPPLLNNSLISGILNQLQNQAQLNISGLETTKNTEKSEIFQGEGLGILENPQFPIKPVTYTTGLSVNNEMQQTINTLIDNPNIFQSLFGAVSNASQPIKSDSHLPVRNTSLLPTPVMPPMSAHSPTVPSRINYSGLSSRNLSPGIRGAFPPPTYQTPTGRARTLGPLLHAGWLPNSSSPVTLSSQPDTLDIGSLTSANPRGRPLNMNPPVWSSLNPVMGNVVGAIAEPTAEPLRPPISTGLNPNLWSPPLVNPRNIPGGPDIPWNNQSGPSLLGSPPPYPITPIGQKRKYDRILPSPEPSPEGNYIGQHSQGIGGHYADSYFKRKRN